MEDSRDHASWQNWFHQHGPKLLLCARQWTRSADDAEDVVQDAFVRFWRHQRHLPGEPIALLLTSIRRAALDRARANDRRSLREDRALAGLDGWTPCFETALDGEERRALVEGALQRLPSDQREVLVLKIWGELTFEQIGGTLEISPNTAASRYRYALGALRRELKSAECHG